MALKVVPAGDEACDIHNRRSPARFVCESCLKEFGVESATPAPIRRRYRPRRVFRRLRSRINSKALVAGGIAVLIALLIVIAVVAGGGGGSGGGAGSGPSQAEVAKALQLVRDPNGGWTTPDDSCAVSSIEVGNLVQSGPVAGNILVEVTNEDRTVGAVVLQKDPSLPVGTCASRIGAALKSRF